MKIPSDMECSFGTTTESEMVYDVKEKMYHIVLDYDTKLKFAAENPTWRGPTNLQMATSSLTILSAPDAEKSCSRQI